MYQEILTGIYVKNFSRQFRAVDLGIKNFVMALREGGKFCQK